MSGSGLCIPRNETAQCAASLFPKQNCYVMSPNSTVMYLWEIYIFPGIGLPIFLQRGVLFFMHKNIGLWQRRQSVISARHNVYTTLPCTFVHIKCSMTVSVQCAFLKIIKVLFTRLSSYCIVRYRPFENIFCILFIWLARMCWALLASVAHIVFLRDVCAGVLKQSMRARNRVGIGLSYRPARLQVHSLAELVP